MRDFVLGMVSVAVVAVGLLLYSQQTTIEAQGQALNQLNARMAELTQATDLDLQAKCAKQADKTYKAQSFSATDLASYSDHYNGALKKCFVLIYDTSTSTADASLFLHFQTLYDAFEGKDYGDYSDFAPINMSKPPVVTECTTTLSDGTQGSCHSVDEFKAAAEYFMGSGL